MIGAVIVAIIIGALYTFLSSGSRTVSLGSEEVEGLRRANIALERIKADLRAICDVVDVNGGQAEVDPDGLGMKFMRFSHRTEGPKPYAFKVTFKAEKTKVTRAGEPMDAVRLRIFYGDSKVPVLDEDCFSELRFKKYWLQGLPFYQVRLGVPDLTGKTRRTHYLQTSVASRYYHGMLGDSAWVILEETAFGPEPAARVK